MVVMVMVVVVVSQSFGIFILHSWRKYKKKNQMNPKVRMVERPKSITIGMSVRFKTKETKASQSIGSNNDTVSHANIGVNQ
jgi:hypothetical protein